MTRLPTTLFTSAAVIFVLGFVLIHTGAYDIAADVPHWPLTSSLLELVRERSIAVRAKTSPVPDLEDEALVAAGAEHYAAMCSGCHLAPGMPDTNLRLGLYPRPPNLSTRAHGHHGHAQDSARQFWIIKHGIKMTAMPAWGASHDDRTLWGLVAFVRQLPGMTPADYTALTRGPGDGYNRHDLSATGTHDYFDQYGAGASGHSDETTSAGDTTEPHDPVGGSHRALQR